MSTVWDFMVAHQVLCTVIAGVVWSSVISSLDAPTADSSAFYRFAFKFLNALAANFARARSTAVESSPNFQDALNRQTDQVGQPQIKAMVSPTPDVKP